MLHERAVADQPRSSVQNTTTTIPRPRKRRRTATEVLAGYFDSPNISRDFFADMANTDETIRAVNSIIARNQSLLIDPRFQHIGSFKTQASSSSLPSSSSPHRHHRSSLPTTRLYNHNTDQDTAQNHIQSPPDRRSKLMGRIQDISHLLLSHYDTEFAKETSPYNSPNQHPPPPQPSDAAPLSPPQNSPPPVLFSPRQQAGQVESPRQVVSPALGPDLRQRSPSIIITEEEASERPPSRTCEAPISMVVTNLPQGRRASYTASPPTPTRSITSLTSHTSSKWPHTPDNELGPCFTEISESYADDYAGYHHHQDDHPSHSHSSSIMISGGDNAELPSLNAASAWQQAASGQEPKSPAPEREPAHWMMMTQIREGGGAKRSDSVVAVAADANANTNGNMNGNGNGNAVNAGAASERRPSVARSFSLDHILSPAPSPSPSLNAPGSPLGKMSVGGTPRAVALDVDAGIGIDVGVDGDRDGGMGMDVEMKDTSPPPTTTIPAATTAIASSSVQPQPEDIRIPFVATPEREMSVTSERPHQPRSRRKSKAIKIVESDEETEGERDRERKGERGRDGERGREKGKLATAGSMVERPIVKNARVGKVSHPKLTIKIRPLTTSLASASAASSTSSVAGAMAFPKSSLSSVTVAEISEERGEKDRHGHGQGGKDDESFGPGARKLTSVSAPVPVAISSGATPPLISTSTLASSASEIPLTPSEQLQTPLPLDGETLPPLIPGKARKRKAPPARKGWKGWVEVEVEENHKPIKGFSLDDLPLGERRTRSGKQFDG